MILLYWSTDRRLTPEERLGQAEIAPVVALTCADSVSLLGSAKAGSVLRPDALVPSPVSWTMAGPMTYRAAMPGIIAIASGFVFSLIFSYLINLFIVGPIVRLSAGIGDYLERGKPLQVKVDTDDEIARLVASVESVIKKCVR